jgi:4-amino-4-deoxychorismate lyase
MSRLLESIKCQDGKLCNLHLHEERMQRAFKSIFKSNQQFKLSNIIKVPSNARQGLFKCRIVYDKQIQEITFEKYKRKKITTIKLIHDESISYSHKYENRENILQHSKKLKKGEELLFVKKGLLRDGSYSNVALYNGSEWHTPAFPLLKGTKRAELLTEGIIKPKRLKVDDLKKYQKISFINAMNDLNELALSL